MTITIDKKMLEKYLDNSTKVEDISIETECEGYVELTVKPKLVEIKNNNGVRHKWEWRSKK